MTIEELIRDYKVKLALSEDSIARLKDCEKIDWTAGAFRRGEANTLRKVIDDLSKLEPDAEDNYWFDLYNTNHPDEVQGHVRNLFD